MTQGNNPLVSVIIPTYNREKFIGDAVENVFAQTYRRIEVIVVDDGSTDGTAEELRKFGTKIRTIRQDNAGPAIARNLGAAMAEGEIIAFQDSDDLWKPEKLERQVSLLQKLSTSVPCCVCNASLELTNVGSASSFDVAEIWPQHDEGMWLNPAEVLATRFVLFNQCAAIRRDAFIQAGGFNEAIRYLEDYDLPLRLAAEGPWAFIREPLTIVRQVATNTFSQEAQRDESHLQHCGLKIFEDVLEKVKDGDQHAGFRKGLNRRVARYRREIRNHKIAEMNFWGAQTSAKVIRGLEHYRNAMFKRSPWFPKMKTSAISTAV